MMLLKNSSLLKLLALLPLLGVSLVLQAETINDHVYYNSQQADTVSTQGQKDESQYFFEIPDQMPEFPGGLSELKNFLSKNVRYPKLAQKAGVEGRVLAQFVVEKDGSVNNVKVVKHVNQELDAEAVRVIKSMPKWKPGIKNGAPVRVRYTLPISFRLDKSAKSKKQPADSTVVNH